MFDPVSLRIFDNAVAGRELRFGLRPGRVVLLLVTNTVLLLLTLFAANLLYTWDELRRDLSPYMPFGSALLLSFGVVESVFLTLYLPFRAGSVLHADRRNRCLDQVAASGMSPLAVHWGHLWTTTAGVTVLLLSALPYFGLCVVFGGASVGQVAAVLLVLFCYALGLSGAAMALGTYQHLIVALVLIPLAITTGLLGAWPDREGLPSVIGAISPLRPLLFMTAQGIPDFQREFLQPVLWGVTVPCWVLSSIYFVAIAGIAVGYLVAGPDVSLTPGLSDFDAVTLGARKGKRRSRWRGLLYIRKIQLAFLYENRPVWLRRSSPWLRRGLVLFAIALVFGLLAALCVPHVRATGPSSWTEAWTDLSTYLPRTSGRPRPDEALFFYGIVAVIWAAGIAPLFRRTTRDQLVSTEDCEWRHPFLGKALFHLVGLAIPAVVLVLALWAAGKGPLLSLRTQTAGLWLMACAYSLTVGSLIAVSCTWVRYPPAGTTIGVLLVLAAVLLPHLWYPFYFFGLLPGPVCFLAIGSLPCGVYLTFWPWERLGFERVGADFSFHSDWRYTLAFYILTAALTTWWSVRVVRRLRKRETENPDSPTRGAPS